MSLRLPLHCKESQFTTQLQQRRSSSQGQKVCIERVTSAEKEQGPDLTPDSVKI